MGNKENKSYTDIKRGQRFRSYFQFSLIAVVLVLVFGIFNLIIGRKSTPKLNPDEIDLIQYQIPADNAEVAVFETSEGTFKAVLYPDEAPNFVMYFEDLVKNGYYDGTYVFAVQEGVYFMGGSKSSDGTTTETTDTTDIEPEISKNLWPFTGALISYGDKGGTFFNQKIMSGSRILFANSVDFTKEFVDELDSTTGENKVSDAFKKKGGIPNFAQQYTIFGQVYEGFEAYDKICGAQVINEDNLRPKQSITINKVYLSTYGENRNDEFFTLDCDYMPLAPSSQAESSAE